MAAIKIRSPKDFRCSKYRSHWLDQISLRHLVLPMAKELDVWLKEGHFAPDLREAPAGWHKYFDSFTIMGEGECLKTVYTIYSKGTPRRESVDLDEWEARGRKPLKPVPPTTPTKGASAELQGAKILADLVVDPDAN